MKCFCCSKVDERITKLGFSKSVESKYITTYIRTVIINCEDYYIHRIDISLCDYGYTVKSYQEDTHDGISNAVELTTKEMKLMLKKCKQLKRKYN